MEEVEDRGKTSHDATGAVQSESAEDDTGGNNDQEEVKCLGCWGVVGFEQGKRGVGWVGRED